MTFEEKKPETRWEVLKAIDVGMAVAVIEVLPLQFPRYSFKIGTRSKMGDYSPHFRAGASVEDIGSALRQAIVAVEALTQESNAKADADRAAYRQKLQEREDHKKVKKQHHEQNLARRREEDRGRAHGGTGSGSKKNKS